MSHASVATSHLRTATFLSLVAVSSLTGACAFFGKADPIVPRYFSPEAVPTAGANAMTTAPANGTATTGGLELRLGRVNAAAYLKDRIVYRDTAYELSYYDERRWTDKPELYVRRALSRALFDQRGLRQIISGPGPTLDVDVLAFEEVRGTPHVARLSLAYTLHDERVIRLSQSITIERPIGESKGGSDDGMGALTSALATAIATAVADLGDKVAIELKSEAASAPAPVVSGETR